MCNISNEAKELFEKGFNCAQSVLFTYGKESFKENGDALRLASGFGAGIAHRGEMCGAVSGGLMVIGLRYGYSELTMDISREMTFKVTKEFIELFEKYHGSVLCNQLIGSEINTSEGLEKAREANTFSSLCPLLVESASEIIESLLQKYPPNRIGDK